MMGFLFNVLMVSLVSMSIHTLAMAGSYNGDDNYVYDRLMKKLLTGYSKEVRPRCDNGSAVEVYIDMELRQITDLNDHLQILKTNVWIRMNWTDCRLSWNSSQFDGIDRIVLPSSSIWIPDLTLYESAADETIKNMRKHMAAITETGFVIFRFPEVLTSLCQINTKNFPFDSQDCDLSFGSWGFSQEDLIMSKNDSSKTLEHFKKSVAWTVFQKRALKSEKLYLGIPYEAVTFSFQLKRKSLFYGFSLIFPWVLMSFIATFAFLLPQRYRISLQGTILLSLTVFQRILLDLMPVPSEKYPFLGIYFSLSIGLVAVSLFSSIIYYLLSESEETKCKDCCSNKQKEDKGTNKSTTQEHVNGAYQNIEKEDKGTNKSTTQEHVNGAYQNIEDGDNACLIVETGPEVEKEKTGGMLMKCFRKLSSNHILFIIHFVASVILFVIFVCLLLLLR